MHSWEVEKLYTNQVASKGSVELDRFKINGIVSERKLAKNELATIISSKSENLVPGSSSKDIRIQPTADFKREDFQKILADAGLEIVRIVKPYESGSTSSQFETYIVKDEAGNEYPVVLGKGKGSTLRAEAYTMKDLEQQIKEILDSPEAAEGYFNVVMQGKEYKISGIATTEGSPKSDFSLNYDNEPVIFISHKDGLTTKDFQQYGGLTRKAGEKISTHPEVEEFVREVKTRFPGGLSSKQHYFKKIEKDDLKLMSMYGSNYGSEFGRDNVNVILQGKVILNKVPNTANTYKLDANKVMYNGELPVKDSEYDPMFFIRFSGSRPGNYNVENARFMVVPRGYIAKKIEEDQRLRQSIDALTKSEDSFKDMLQRNNFGRP
jgi:hypothetical protein